MQVFRISELHFIQDKIHHFMLHLDKSTIYLTEQQCYLSLYHLTRLTAVQPTESTLLLFVTFLTKVGLGYILIKVYAHTYLQSVACIHTIITVRLINFYRLLLQEVTTALSSNGTYCHHPLLSFDVWFL